MKRYIPGRVELAFFLAMAVVGAAIVQISPSRDYAIALFGMPVFLIAALLGLRRSDLVARAAANEAEEESAE